MNGSRRRLTYKSKYTLSHTLCSYPPLSFHALDLPALPVIPLSNHHPRPPQIICMQILRLATPTPLGRHPHIRKVRFCHRIRIGVLSLYVPSLPHLKRPAREITYTELVLRHLHHRRLMPRQAHKRRQRHCLPCSGLQLCCSYPGPAKQ